MDRVGVEPYLPTRGTNRVLAPNGRGIPQYYLSKNQALPAVAPLSRCRFPHSPNRTVIAPDQRVTSPMGVSGVVKDMAGLSRRSHHFQGTRIPGRRQVSPFLTR